MSSPSHIATWFEEIGGLFSSALPRNFLLEKFGVFGDVFAEKFFTALGLGSMRDDFTSSDIQPRSHCFVEEAKKRGVTFKVFRGPFGYTNHFTANMGGKNVRFQNLPTANAANSYANNFTDDKDRTKKHLIKGKFPVAEGRAFWFWQKNKAMEFGMQKIGFPLVVKPRSGSVSRHVTTGIEDRGRLRDAVNYALIYSPVFIVEKFIPDSFVHRATVVDFDFAACLRQVPAHVRGDGASTVRELIDSKNNDPRRGGSQQKESILHKIVENETTQKLLSEKRRTFSTIVKKDEIVYLQKDPFLKLGGDLVEETPDVHPDNLQLFYDIARFFDIRVVGIDFLAKDISRSWREQQCAVLELNSVPCIELHHFPTFGKPQNVARALVDLFFKYYV